MKLETLRESSIAQGPLNTQGCNWEKKIKEMRALPELGGDKEVRSRMERGGAGAGQKPHRDSCATLGTLPLNTHPILPLPFQLQSSWTVLGALGSF